MPVFFVCPMLKNVRHRGASEVKCMGQCPKCPGIYRGTVGQTTSSRKVGVSEVCI